MVALFAVLACADAPNGRGWDANGGGKADDASDGYDPSLSAHRNAVGACIAMASESRAYRDLEDVETELVECIAEANDEVWDVVQQSLPAQIYDRRARDHRPPQDKEVERIVGLLRDAQERVCKVIVTATATDEDDAALTMARCLSLSELHTANLIDAHVELGGKPAEIAPPWRRYDVCKSLFEEQAAHGLSEAFFAYRDCAKEIDAELRVPWAKEIAAEENLSLMDALVDVSDVFEHESRVGWDLCRLFSYGTLAGIEPEVAEAQCAAESAMQIGRLLEALAIDLGEHDPDAEPEPDPEPGEPDPDEPDAPLPMPGDGEVCFPETCLPLSYPSPTPDGYAYEEALGGDPNYRKPIAYLDLQAFDPNTRLTADFTLGEIAQAHKGRWAIVQPHAVVSLQDLREDVGAITVVSGYRSPSYNVGVGGARYSRHMYGDGFDLDPNDVSLDDLERACVQRGGFLVEYTSHVHCDFRLDPVDEAFFGPS